MKFNSILSILLAVILLFSILTTATAAAEADTTNTGATSITSVAASVTMPAAGQLPSYSASVPSGKGYKVTDRTSGSYQNGVSWSVASEGDRTMSSGEKFVKGKKYTVSILLSTSSSAYEFGTSVSAMINNQNALSYRNSASSLRISYTFTNLDTDTAVNSASCTITAPAAGQTRDASPVSGDSAKYSVSLNVCYQETPYKFMGASDKFESGKTYVYAINFNAKSGYTFTNSTEYYINGVKAEKYAEGVYSAKFTASGGTSGYTVSGTFTTYLDAAGTVKIQLISNTTISTLTFTGNTGSYSFINVPASSYKIRVSKENHVPCDYAINVFQDVVRNVKIHPIGDINGDGVVNNFDYGRINSHARGKSTLTDYAFKCGDVNGDGNINNFDAGRINSHARGKSSLWS